MEQDGFPALSGIARQIEKRTRYHYKAGMWAEDLHVGLLWSSNGTGRKRENIECPSWSWASVVFPGPDMSHCPYNVWFGPRSLTKKAFPAFISNKALIKNVDLETNGGDIYGVIRSGTLTIEGNFQSRTDWLSRHSHPLLYKRGERFDLSDLTKPRPGANPFMNSPHILCELDYHEEWPDNWTTENQAQFETGVAFLQIYRLYGREDDEGYSGYYRGYEKLGIAYALILESAGNEGEYRRRGIAEIPCEEGMADDGWAVRVVNII